jgi:hypothetical protein
MDGRYKRAVACHSLASGCWLRRLTKLIKLVIRTKPSRPNPDSTASKLLQTSQHRPLTSAAAYHGIALVDCTLSFPSAGLFAPHMECVGHGPLLFQKARFSSLVRAQQVLDGIHDGRIAVLLSEAI